MTCSSPTISGMLRIWFLERSTTSRCLRLHSCDGRALSWFPERLRVLRADSCPKVDGSSLNWLLFRLSVSSFFRLHNSSGRAASKEKCKTESDTAEKHLWWSFFKKKLYGSLLCLLLNIHRLFTCCPIFKYCIFTNIVCRRWGCHQNAGEHYVYNGLLLWRSHCTIPQQFCGIGRPSPSHTICLSKLAAKLTLFTVHSKDSPFQVQINFLSIITPPEEAYRCNSKRQNASRILPFSRL